MLTDGEAAAPGEEEDEGEGDGLWLTGGDVNIYNGPAESDQQPQEVPPRPEPLAEKRSRLPALLGLAGLAFATGGIGAAIPVGLGMLADRDREPAQVEPREERVIDHSRRESIEIGEPVIRRPN